MLFVTTWMELEDVMLSKVGQAQQAKHRVISIICASQMFALIKAERERMVTSVWVAWGSGETWDK